MTNISTYHMQGLYLFYMLYFIDLHIDHITQILFLLDTDT